MAGVTVSLSKTEGAARDQAVRLATKEGFGQLLKNLTSQDIWPRHAEILQRADMNLVLQSFKVVSETTAPYTLTLDLTYNRDVVRSQNFTAEVGDAIMRGEDIDVIEIDGASNRGIDDARDLIAGAGIAPARGAFKIYIIDEVHMLTTPAFNALLKTMEEPPPHVKFILCTTEPHKVPATIQSRCQRFDFRNIPATRIAGHLRDVLAKESIQADDAAVMQVARLANGSMRDGLSLLDRLVAASADGRVTEALLAEVLGLPDTALVRGVSSAIGSGDARGALGAAGALLEGGSSVEQALELLADRFRTLMVAAVCGADSELVELGEEARREAAEDARAFEPATLAHLVAVCDAVLRSCKQSGAPRTLFDAAVVRMALASRFAPSAEAAAPGGPPGLPAKKATRPE